MPLVWCAKGCESVWSSESVPPLRAQLCEHVNGLPKWKRHPFSGGTRETLTVGSKIIQALEIIRVKKFIPNAVL